MNDMILMLGCVFGAVAMLAFVLARALTGSGGDTKLRTRLTANATRDPIEEQQQHAGGGMVEMVQKVGSAAAKPFMPNTREKQSALRKKLGFAGIYSPTAIKVMTGLKVICLG